MILPYFADPELLTRDRIEPKTLNHLTKVFIQSQGDNATIQRKKDFLPVERSSTHDYEYGFEEPKNIPLGKVSMKQLLDLINNHEVKPHEFSPEVLAEHYKLNVDDVRNIVKYYKPFQVHVPKKQPKKEGPKGLKLIQHKIDQLKE